MSKTHKPEDQLAEHGGDLPAKLIDAARRAVRVAVREHKLLGNPIAARRDGKVVIIPPEEIEI